MVIDNLLPRLQEEGMEGRRELEEGRGDLVWGEGMGGGGEEGKRARERNGRGSYRRDGRGSLGRGEKWFCWISYCPDFRRKVWREGEGRERRGRR